ncbi:unnamed protein product [Phytomonas sp. Hart1]|nr:unnamed protein product [Phytomonas sp. Hart1]|eukprot:CCW69278.1 unnamed protein product [Phytomonas sp. isolate Hart1]
MSGVVETVSAAPSLFARLRRRVSGCDLRVVLRGPPASPGTLPRFDGEARVEGDVVLTPTAGSFHHRGLLVELLGTISTGRGPVDRAEVFLRQQRRFAPGAVVAATTFSFSFGGGRTYESYHGARAQVDYVVQASLERGLRSTTASAGLWITRPSEDPEKEPPIPNDNETEREPQNEMKSEGMDPPWRCRRPVVGLANTRELSMEIGVENLLHIEVRYEKQTFHLADQILGRVAFKTANMDLQRGEVAVVRKEFIIGGDDEEVETEVLHRFEIMDGAPIVGEVILIRLYLISVPGLTPSYANVGNKFRVLHFLDLMLLTRDGRKYFKQQQIHFYRQKGQEGMGEGSVM